MPGAALPLGRPPGPGRVRRALQGPGSRRDAVFPMRAARHRHMRGPGSARVAASPAQRRYINNWRQRRLRRSMPKRSKTNEEEKDSKLTGSAHNTSVGFGHLLAALGRGLLWCHRRHLRQSPGVRVPDGIQKHLSRRVGTNKKISSSEVWSQGLTNGVGFAWMYGAFPNCQSSPKLALEMSLTRRATWSAASRVFAMRLGSWRPVI